MAGYLHPVEIDEDPVLASRLGGEGDRIDPVLDLLHVKGSLDRPAIQTIKLAPLILRKRGR